MPELDPQALLLGLGLGLAASTLFFGGLGWGLRRALRARHPGPILALSFVLRAAVLLGVAGWLLRLTHPLSSLPAYLLAFFLVRGVALRWARRGSATALSGPENG
jgi:F1F0 ATPase subunit 2